jgi:hypothetical protein
MSGDRLLRVLGLVNRGARESVEMQYEFEQPFLVDSSKITDKLDLTATPVEEALAHTMCSYRG